MTTVEFPVSLTPRADRILNEAHAVAKHHGADTFIGVEHIFLAILDDRQAIPTQVLDRLGVRAEVVTQVEELLASDGYRNPTTKVGDSPPD